MAVSRETRLPRKLTQRRPCAWERRAWHSGVGLISVHSTLVRPHPEVRGQLVEIRLKIQGLQKDEEEAKGPEHYLMWRMVEEARVFNLEKRSLRAKRELFSNS